MINFRFRLQSGQTAVEYMLLLAVVTAIILIAFKTLLPRAHDASNLFYNRTTVGILGKPNPCGDGFCDPTFEEGTNKCCIDCSDPLSCP